MSGRGGFPSAPLPSPDDGPSDLSALIPDSREEASPRSERLSRRRESETGANSGTRRGEVRQVLEELDRLSDDLNRRPGTAVAPSESAVKAWDEGSAGGAASSPYLEERLAVASASASALSRELRDLGERWQGLEDAAERLEEEIGNANREMGFLHAAESSAPPSPLPTPAVLAPVAPRLRPSGNHLRRANSTGPAPYGGFTIARYNSTIGGLKARRLQLAWWTVGLAIGISAILVVLSVVAREPMPVVWLAILPIVWLIPVPFFLLSFLATQRVLRRNHLDLTGDP